MECNYRNCNKEIEGRRRHAKYCSNNCRRHELTYIKRHKKWIENCKAAEMEKVIQIKKLKAAITGVDRQNREV